MGRLRGRTAGEFLGLGVLLHAQRLLGVGTKVGRPLARLRALDRELDVLAQARAGDAR